MRPTISFTAVWPDYFALEGFTSPLVAGTPSDLTLKAKLNSGETFASFAGTVEIDLTGTRDWAGVLIFPEKFFATFTIENQGVLALPSAALSDLSRNLRQRPGSSRAFAALSVTSASIPAASPETAR